MRLEIAQPLVAGHAAPLWFEWAFISLATWQTIGGHLDGWAHIHFAGLESFFTPWHAVLYSGFTAVAIFLLGSFVRYHAHGYPWRRALPDGYGLSLLGAMLFLAAGIGDMVWHQLFGIEVDLEAALSPTHLTLALGAGLIVSGPLRAAIARVDATRGRGLLAALPTVLSLTYTFSLLTFMTQYANPFGSIIGAEIRRPPDVALGALGIWTLKPDFLSQVTGLFAILLHTALLMGIVLFTICRVALPAGSLTVVFSLSALLMLAMRGILVAEAREALLLVAVIGGIAADLLMGWLRPAASRPTQLRLFAFAAPLFLFAAYFVAVSLTVGVWWSVPLWTGAVALAGVVGWLLSYLALPGGTAPPMGWQNSPGPGARTGLPNGSGS